MQSIVRLKNHPNLTRRWFERWMQQVDSANPWVEKHVVQPLLENDVNMHQLCNSYFQMTKAVACPSTTLLVHSEGDNCLVNEKDRCVSGSPKKETYIILLSCKQV